MRNLWLVWVWIAALFVLNVAARAQQIDYANPNDPYYQISEITNTPVAVEVAAELEPAPLDLREIGYQVENFHRNLGPQASEESSTDSSVMTPMSITPYAIAQLLFKAWDIVIKGKPVVNIEVKNASALPVLADYKWSMLTGWQKERVVKSKLRIKNLLGGYPIEMDTAVKLMFGGSARGRGMYIASARVVPSNVHVNWGYNLDVSVNVPSVVNTSGRDDDPIPQITLEISYKVQSQIGSFVIKKSNWKEVYKLQGDGYFLDYTHGKEYFPAVYHAPAPPLPSPSPTPASVLPGLPGGNSDPLFGSDDPWGTPAPTPKPGSATKPTLPAPATSQPATPSSSGILPLPIESTKP